MAERIDAREAETFFLDVPEKLDDHFPDLAYFRKNRPVFYRQALGQGFVFRRGDVSKLFSGAYHPTRPCGGIRSL